MALQPLDINKIWYRGTLCDEPDWDNIKDPLEAWAASLLRDINQLALDMFGPTYSFDNDGLPNNPVTLYDFTTHTTALPWIFSNTVTFNGTVVFSGLVGYTGAFGLSDLADDHFYLFNRPFDLAADRNITLPLLLADDTFVFENFIQSLANKTLTSPIVNSGDFTTPHIRGAGVGDAILQYANSATDRTYTIPDIGANTNLQPALALSGQMSTVDVNNIANIFWRNTYANPTVTLTLVGGLFDPAHYTELRTHDHGNTGNASITHTHTTTTGGVSANHTHTGTSGNASATHTHDTTTGTESATHVHGIRVNTTEITQNEIALSSTGNTSYQLQLDTDGSGTPAGPYNALDTESATHTHTGTSGNESATHTHDTTTGNESADHTHTGTSGNESVTHTHATVAAGTTTVQVLTAAEKTYLNAASVFIDGVDRTAALLVLANANYPAAFATLGDGTVGHQLNNWTLADPGPGTGALDISTYVATVAYHRIEIRQAGVAGGKLNWFLSVR